MKIAVRKIMSLLCVVAMLASCLGTMSFTFAAGIDIAPDAVASANSVKDPAERINDGDEGTRWTAQDTHGAGTTGDWKVWLTWDETQSIDSLSILWEVCYGKEFSIQISDDGTNWTKIKDVKNNKSGWQDIDLGGTYSTKNLGIFITSKDNTWGVAIWEIKVYNPEVSAYVTDALEKNIEIAEDAFGTHGVNVYGYSDTSWANYVSAYRTAKTALEKCYNQSIGVPGYESQAVIDVIADNLSKAMAKLPGGGTADKNVMANAIMFYDSNNLTTYCHDINLRSLSDGLWKNDANNFQPDPNRTEGASIYLGLVKASDINNIAMYTESEGYNMSIYYTTADLSNATDYEGYAAIEWTELCNTSNDLAISYKVKDGISFYSFDFDTVEDITAIKITSNNGGWFKIHEVLAYNDNATDFHMTQILGDNLTGRVEHKGEMVDAKFFCTNVTKDALEGKGAIRVAYTIERGGETIAEVIYITEAYSRITLGDLTISSADFDGGRAGDYVVGVLFLNVRDGDKITVTFNGVGNKEPVGETTATAAAPEGNETTEGIKISDRDGDGVIRVACVGDSITAGTSNYNYPMYLAEYLAVLGKQNGNTYEVMNFGKGSAAVWRRYENLDANGDGVINPEGEYFWYDSKEYTSSLQYPADVVILQMGTNDSVANNTDNFPTYFKDHYINYLVKPYQDLGAKVIVSTAPWTYDWFWAGTNTYVRDAQLEIAEELGLDVVDMNKFLENKKEAFGPNGDVHPNASGYTIMAEAFYKYIFGGETVTATVNTVAGATVTAYDVVTGREYVFIADANGVAKYEFVKGISYYLSVTVSCDGYATSDYNELIVKGTDVSEDMPLVAN